MRLTWFVVINFFYSCESCGDAISGPPSFSVELIDKITNENVFTSGRYTESQLSLTNIPNLNSFFYSFVSENNYNIISITPAWSEGVFRTTIKLNNEIEIPITSVIQKISGKCSDSYTISGQIVENFEYSNDAPGILKIKI